MDGEELSAVTALTAAGWMAMSLGGPVRCTTSTPKPLWKCWKMHVLNVLSPPFMSPTQLSLKHLRSQGYLATVVEHFNAFAKVRQDLFGFADLLAIKDGMTLAVQTTTASNMSARRTKLLGNPAVAACLKAGWAVRIEGWRKVRLRRGCKVHRWQCRTVEITGADYV